MPKVDDRRGALEALTGHLHAQPGIRIGGKSHSGLLAGARPCGWLRHTECPDAIVEQPDDYGAIVDLIRCLRARRCAAPNAVAATQTRYLPEASEVC
jgi:hypothetical protein